MGSGGNDSDSEDGWIRIQLEVSGWWVIRASVESPDEQGNGTRLVKGVEGTIDVDERVAGRLFAVTLAREMVHVGWDLLT